jgi:hypothetical protein
MGEAPIATAIAVIRRGGCLRVPWRLDLGIGLESWQKARR